MVVSIIYDSGYGHTKKQAEAIVEGVHSATGTKARLIAVANDPIAWEVLTTSDAIIFGSPAYSGMISARFKQFIDDSTKAAWMPQTWRNKIAAGFTSSGFMHGDKLNPGVVRGPVRHDLGRPGFIGKSPDAMNQVDGWLGTMAYSKDESPELSPIKSDLDTAFYLGKRVALTVDRFRPI